MPAALTPARAYLVAMQRQPLQSDYGDRIVDLAMLQHGPHFSEGQGFHQDVLTLGLQAEDATRVRRIDVAEEDHAALRAGAGAEDDVVDRDHFPDLERGFFDRFTARQVFG